MADQWDDPEAQAWGDNPRHRTLCVITDLVQDVATLQREFATSGGRVSPDALDDIEKRVARLRAAGASTKGDET